MKPTFSSKFQAKNRHQGMQMLSMHVELLEDLLSASTSVGMLINGEFIVSDNELVMSLYTRCQNIAKTYGLDFSFNLNRECEQENEPAPIINSAWIISESRVVELNQCQERELAEQLQYELSFDSAEQRLDGNSVTGKIHDIVLKVAEQKDDSFKQDYPDYLEYSKWESSSRHCY